MNKSFTVSWKSPANIALVKYWGKHGLQLPHNPSVSITLAEACTHTSVTFTKATKQHSPKIEFLFHGAPNPNFAARVEHYIQMLQNELPFLLHYDLQINSSNNFPHSSGISSSASFMSSLALCLCSAEQMVTGIVDPAFYKHASYIARLGSGSAARSVFGGYVLWGQSQALEHSANEYAVPVNTPIHPVFKTYCNAVLIIDPGNKPISSSAGHSLMDRNPFSSVRYKLAHENTIRLLEILHTGDTLAFAGLVEHEALSLHAMLLTSQPWHVLLKPDSLEVINRIRWFREHTGAPVCFTIDAGPNIHLLYPEVYSDKVHSFIDQQIKPFLHNGVWINDRIGSGPEKVF